jgi:hypothetical protein
MGTAQQQPKPVDPERLAALMGRYDTSNPSEAEAMNAARMMRRMVGSAGVRLIDALERPDVREALDRALQPVRSPVQNSPALLAAQQETKELHDMLSVVVPKLREVTEALMREMELTAQLREHGSKTCAGVDLGCGEPFRRGLIAVVTALAIWMLVASAFYSDVPDVVEPPAAVAPHSELMRPKKPHAQKKGRKGEIQRTGKETNEWTGKP